MGRPGARNRGEGSGPRGMTIQLASILTNGPQPGAYFAAVRDCDRFRK